MGIVDNLLTLLRYVLVNNGNRNLEWETLQSWASSKVGLVVALFTCQAACQSVSILYVHT